jgi:hypothetical protein
VGIGASPCGITGLSHHGAYGTCVYIFTCTHTCTCVWYYLLLLPGELLLLLLPPPPLLLLLLPGAAGLHTSPRSEALLQTPFSQPVGLPL